MTVRQGAAARPRPAAVVFDVDGLPMDTGPCWTVAENELFARRGLPCGDEQKAPVVGRSLPAACDVLGGYFDEPGSAEAIQTDLLDSVTDVVDNSARPMDGAHEIVDLDADPIVVSLTDAALLAWVRTW